MKLFSRPSWIAAALVGLATVGLATTTSARRDVEQAPADGGHITSIPGVTVGHHTLAERPTGCTVILVSGRGATGAVVVSGGAPGTAETDLLAPENSVRYANAVVLSGGSAFGLAASVGVRDVLSARGVGYRVGPTVVPIVPAAIIFDLGVGGRPEIRPGADCGRAAVEAATGGAVDEGSVGAGAGATVGKMRGGRPMKGGLGSAALRSDSGLIVGAVMVVNAVGSVVDPRTGQPVAGALADDGRTLLNPFELVRRGTQPASPALANTTIGVVVTNADLTKAEALKVAQMAQAGMARAIVPAFTASDGDTIFVLATGSLDGSANVSAIGALAAEAVSDAILRAVRQARGLPGYPSVADIR